MALHASLMQWITSSDTFALGVSIEAICHFSNTLEGKRFEKARTEAS